jgi:hypothetical protein
MDSPFVHLTRAWDRVPFTHIHIPEPLNASNETRLAVRGHALLKDLDHHSSASWQSFNARYPTGASASALVIETVLQAQH